MSDAPATKDWSARIDTQPLGPPTFHVTGQVETRGGNLQPVLAPRSPQGFNPKIRQLVLTIEDKGGGGTKDIAFRACDYVERPVERRQYDSVEIFWEADVIARADVRETS
jgi:hypothetical protein